jgi:hypothetical protein
MEITASSFKLRANVLEGRKRFPISFLGIGAQKAGTTWLYANLRKHPALGFPAGKEVHFWDENHARGIGWYRSLFPDEGERLLGEMTPAYAILPPERIAECHHYFPDLRLIYIIRNPIDRAWSAAKMALVNAQMTMAEASDQWFLDHFHSQASRTRGDHEACLRNWRGAFPKESLLVLRFEDLAREPEQFLTRCCRHLQIADFQAVREEAHLTHVHMGEAVPLRASLRPTLHRLYAEKILSLGRYLDEDFSSWLD